MSPEKLSKQLYFILKGLHVEMWVFVIIYVSVIFRGKNIVIC